MWTKRHGRWVLVVRSGGARLFRGLRGRERPALDFAANEAGYAALRQLVERSAPPPVHLLVDVLEEDFQHESVPHVRGPARRAVLATRSARLFHGTPYVSARGEGRSREGRRDERVLFSAIARPERLGPWLGALRGKKVAGVHSLPVASARLLPLLQADAGRVLLVTEGGERDLRQTCFEDGRLTSSRLATIPPPDSTDRARSIVAEIDRFVRHLDRSVQSERALDIRLVGDASLLTAIRELDDTGRLAEGLVDTGAAERRLGGRGRATRAGSDDGPGRGCDRMFALLAVRERLPNHYAPPEALAVHRSAQVARALVAAGASLLLAGSAWAGLVSHRSGDLAAGTDSLVREARSFEDRIRAERASDSGGSNVALEDIRTAVETASRLDAGRVPAFPILRTVSDALSGFPDLRLESLEWFEVSERDQWTGPSEEDAPRERLRIVHLRGRVEPFHGHYRAAAEEVFRLADELGALPRLRDVEVTHAPLDPGGTRHRDGRVAEFEMRMVVDAGNE